MVLHVHYPHWQYNLIRFEIRTKMKQLCVRDINEKLEMRLWNRGFSYKIFHGAFKNTQWIERESQLEEGNHLHNTIATS